MRDKQMYEIKTEAYFSAAHHLLNYDGECEHQHGHNWKVEVYVRGESLDQSNILIDFKVLKRHLETLPIVKLSLHQIEELESIINDYYDNKCDYDSINDYISNVYALTEEERAYMRYSRDI